MPHSLPSSSIFTREYVAALVRVVGRVLPVLGVTEVVRAALDWHTHPLNGRLDGLFGLLFLVGALALARSARPLRVIRLVFLAAMLLSLTFDLFGYVLLPPEITPANTAYALTGRYMYLPFTMMLLSWLLFPARWATRLALGVYLASLGTVLVASGAALAQHRTSWEGLVNLTLHQVVVGGSFYVLLQVFMAVYARQADLERERAQLQRDARHDALTGLANRRAFDELLAREISRAHTLECPLSLVTFDLDHFKRVNDTHGHDLGDRVLLEVAGLLRGLSRAGDLPARWGGEEFVWLLPGADAGAAERAAERLRAAVAAHPFPHGTVTISLGTATLLPGEDAGGLFARADAALYRAKRAGRNRVGEVWDALQPV